MTQDLAEKRLQKKEIEDWLEEKVTVEFQLEAGRARLRAVGDEMADNQKAFDQEKGALLTAVRKKQDQYTRLKDSISGIGGDIMLEKELPLTFVNDGDAPEADEQ